MSTTHSVKIISRFPESVPDGVVAGPLMITNKIKLISSDKNQSDKNILVYYKHNCLQ